MFYFINPIFNAMVRCWWMPFTHGLSAPAKPLTRDEPAE